MKNIRDTKTVEERARKVAKNIDKEYARTKRNGGVPNPIDVISLVKWELKAHAAEAQRGTLRELDKKLDWFCKNNGAQEVHRSWRDNMLAQDRWVDAIRIKWDTLPEIDKLLDEKIAKDVIQDFLAWAMGGLVLEQLGESDHD